MSFVCPNCSGKGSLHISASLELPPDNRSDEITLQVAECGSCGFFVLAVYEESRRGALDREAFSHTGYPIEAKMYNEIAAAMAGCASPRNPACSCPGHIRFSRQDKTGRWAGLDDLMLGSGINLIYQSPGQVARD